MQIILNMAFIRERGVDNKTNHLLVLGKSHMPTKIWCLCICETICQAQGSINHGISKIFEGVCYKNLDYGWKNIA